MLWVKSLHIVFVVTWFAALFYLPRLFVYHAQASDPLSIERFKLMERRLLRGIMTPSAVLTLIFGLWLWLGFGFSGNWLIAKLGLVLLLFVYHMVCARIVTEFRADRNRHSERWYRVFNEVPAVLLIAIVILVVVKPF
jgi:protoporphyrinogen IX oxidase